MRRSQFAVFTEDSSKTATLAFNTLTKEFLRIDERYSEFTENLARLSFDSDLALALTRGGFLVDQSEDEYTAFLLRYRQDRYGPQPLVIYVSPTLECNASCEYCFQRDIREDLPRQRGPDQKALVDFVANRIHSCTSLKITWFGGEPLLRRSYIEVASDNLTRLMALAGKPYYATMVTNGLLLDSDAVKILSNAQIRHLQISLDGTEEIHNSIGRRDAKRGFADIISNVAALPDDFKVAFRINISRKNVSSLPELLEQLAAAGLARPNILIDLPLVFDFSIDNDAARYGREEAYVIPNSDFGGAQLRLLAYARSLGFAVEMDDVLIPGGPQCHAIRSHGFSVWPDGAITRCVHEVATPEGANIANPASADAPSLQRWIAEEVFATGPCRTCFYLPICGGSCVHERFQGVNPPACCPPSKHTLQDRMRWYDASFEGGDVPIDFDKASLGKELTRLAAEQERSRIQSVVHFYPKSSRPLRRATAEEE